jgi:hypothetical protein
MKKIWILLGIALVLVLFGFRERLEPTDKIKAPRSEYPHYSDEEVDRVISLIPTAITEDIVAFVAYQLYNNSRPDPELSETKRTMRYEMMYAMTYFYNEIYAPSQTAITEDDVNTFFVLSDRGGYFQALRTWLAAGLKAYFVDQQDPRQPTAEPPSPPVAEPTPPPAAEPTPAGNQIPSRWTHACFFSPTNQ